MDVTEAVATAKNYVLRLFADERISHLGLEEAFFDESRDRWHITLGFSRPRDNPENVLEMLGRASPKRQYKVVEISDKDSKVKAVKNYTQ
jgi:NOL1/NOP2/fmu family ribosome biogenesis protein